MLSVEPVAQSIIAAVAAWLVVEHIASPTPIDAVLPLVALVIVLALRVAQASSLRLGAGSQAGSLRHTGGDLAAPLLVVAAFTIPDERLRLLAYGVIVATALASALAFFARSLTSQIVIAITAIVVLRWLPRPELWREVIVMLGALAVLVAIRSRSPLAVVVSVAIALLTPTHPGRAMLLPFVVALLVLPVRWAWRVPRVVLAPIYAAAFACFALWPWSGLVARGFPAFLRAETPRDAQTIGRALRASQSIELPVDGKRGVVVTMSGMNVARMRGGRVVATIESGGTRRDVRIGDIADFGFLRRDQWFRARNPLPRVPLNDVRGYGIEAFLYGAGRVRVDGRIASLRITAAPDLPPDAAIEVESVETQ